MKTLRRLVDFAKIKQFTFSGGEPTLSKHLIECVVFLRLKGKKVTVITNASANDVKLYSDLISCGVSNFQITINAVDESIHDKLAQKKGALKSTLRNINYIIENGGNVVPTIVLTKLNSHAIEESFDLFLEYGFKTIIVNRYNISSGGYSVQLNLGKRSLNNCFEQINNICSTNNLNVTSNVCTPFCILNPKNYPNIKFGTCPDNPYLKPITFESNGNVRLCSHSPQIIGNIFDNDLREMLHSQYANSWISTEPKYCRNCNLYDDCKGGCKAASEQIYGKLDVDPMIKYNNYNS